VLARGAPEWGGGTGLLPIGSAGAAEGVLAVHRPAELALAERELAQVCCQRLASAIARVRLEQDAREVRLQIEVERVRAALLSSVSHDLRTPLAMILASAQMLVRSHVSMDARLRGEVLSDIADEAERLDAVLRNLLAMTRVESGELRPQLLPASVDEVVTGALRRMDHRLVGRSVERSHERGLPLVDLDVLLFEQALINVLDNALRYSPSGSPLSIRAGRTGDQIQIQVADSGVGVHEDEQQSVFEKFRRGRNAPRADGGVGLGLTICRAILAAHGGRIELANGPNGGAIATLTLPIGKVALGDATERLPDLE
jgi:two-component system, OmpR family, sensor histidine kinase KdpD